MSKRKRYLFGLLAVGTVLAASLATWHYLRPGPDAATHHQAAPDTRPVCGDHQTISFVILPPDGVPGYEGQAEAVAIFCDLLAERLSMAPGITVVDRSRLDRILAERMIGGPGQPPVLSYDAMVRVRLGGSVENPTIVVEVVDLSLGNLAASGQWPWQPEGDEAVSKAADLCMSARRALAAGSDTRLKVRVLHVPQHLRTARVEAFGEDLALELIRLLERSPRVRVVHHLEAMSAKEESLLLLLGLSRLGGGRQFAPQADLALELRLLERDAVGKTFDRTPIEVAVSLNWAGKEADRTTFRGTPGGRQALLTSLRAELAKHVQGLDALGPQPAPATLRRKQAALELKRSDQWNVVAYNARGLAHLNSKPESISKYRSERLKELAEIAAAAAKIDPTYEEAAFQAAKFGFVHLMVIGNPADGSPALREALNYLRRFNEVPDHRAEIVMLVRGGLAYRDPMREKTPFSGLQYGDPQGWYDYSCGYWTPGSGAVRQPVDLLRKIIDFTLAQEATACPHLYYGDMIWIAHLGMIGAGTDVAEARRWRDAANTLAMNRLRRAVSSDKPARVSQMAGRDPYCVYMYCCNHLSLAMHWANQEKGPEHAKALLEEFMAAGPRANISLSGADISLHEWVRKLKDPGLQKRFKAWVKSDSPRSPQAPAVLRVRWPRISASKLYEETKATVKDPSRYLLSGQADREVLWEPVGFLGNRLYVLYRLKSADRTAGRPHGMGWIESPGAPAPPRRRDVTVHTPATFPVPPEELMVSCWALTDGKVALGTGKHGILVFDPNTAVWRQYGPSEGLPLASVRTLHVLPKEVVLACGTGRTVRQHNETDVKEEVLYTLDLGNGQVRLVRRLVISGRKGHLGAFRERTKGLCLAWPSGQEWIALGRYNVVRDVLGAAPRIEPWRMKGPLPWKRLPQRAWPEVTAASAVEAGGHVLVRMREALVQFDAAFKPVAQWRVNSSIGLGEGVGGYNDDTERLVGIPGDIPTHYGFDLLGGGGDWAVMQSSGKLLLLHVPTQTWHGPVACDVPGDGAPGMRMTCAVNGDLLAVWGGVFSIKQIVAAAKAANCLWTDKQFRQVQTDLLLAQPPRDALKYALLARRFEDARRLLDQQLQVAGDDGELLLLGAWLNEKPSLNDPAVAEAYYRRLAGLKGNLPARLRGMVSLCYFLNRQGRLDEAMRLAENINREFYTASAGQNVTRRAFDRLVREIRSRAKKRPASAASDE